METHTTGKQPHVHGPGCGHQSVKHGDHVDYIFDGHLHHVQDDGTIDHILDVTVANPDVCRKTECRTPGKHGPEAERIPHGDHVDYLVQGRLHHVHGDHCDDHGQVTLS